MISAINIIGYEPPGGGAPALTNLIVAVIVLAVFLALGTAISFLFFGYLAYLEDFQNMVHEETRRHEHR